ncbi:hypothetical protein Dda_9141 [Drechslerella dactyloides]|uniref:4'-phosphopantetheinyl transferase domain-containing protein n=1 Tax=Drechslerella dactyloides TaxID=74499 RepID=A0AAD6IPM9_DREDA|nr:hypothetical protein Dda_9141 [Drechslerella dactyloides]
MNNVFTHGIGVDVLHLPRLVSLLSRRPAPKLARRILTPLELAEFQQLPSVTAAPTTPLANAQTRYLATRWAAKEASYKASTSLISTTNEQWMSWKNFEITHGARGEPLLTIRTASGIELGKGLISISHDGEYIVAMAMVPHKF